MRTNIPTKSDSLAVRLNWIAEHENDGEFVVQQTLPSVTVKVTTGEGRKGEYFSRRHHLIDGSVLDVVVDGHSFSFHAEEQHPESIIQKLIAADKKRRAIEILPSDFIN